ncbi:plasmid mobilization protein [Sunxiuqinia indica]|uniref:plasmid mobilization protein n=1 Tax=Sunxiuqinia indica TaxID=2692584 RepID=UPI00135939B6|nr:plasmid mobilization relaxosome protein MobC [Sunxiuqinia indica]
MKNRYKTGRPNKKLGEKKSYRVSVKMATAEYYSLKAKAREAGINRSEFIRKSIQKSVIKQRLSTEILDLVRKLCGMANNLNQIARKANAVGYADARSEYLFLAGKIDNLLEQIRNDG